MLDAFLAEVALVDKDEAGMSRLGLRLTEAEYEELTERIDALLNEYQKRPRSPDGHAYSIFLSVHRDVTRDLPTLPAAS
jgi:hypothetical protein